MKSEPQEWEALADLPIRWRFGPDLGVPRSFALRTALAVTGAAVAGLTRGPVPPLYESNAVYQLDPRGCNTAVPWFTTNARGRGDCQDVSAWRLAERYQATGEWPDGEIVNGGRPGLIHVRLEDEDPSLLLTAMGRARAGRGTRGPECEFGVWPDSYSEQLAGAQLGDDGAGLVGVTAGYLAEAGGGGWGELINQLVQLGVGIGGLVAENVKKDEGSEPAPADGGLRGRRANQGQDDGSPQRTTPAREQRPSQGDPESTEGEGWASSILALIRAATAEAGGCGCEAGAPAVRLRRDRLHPDLQELLRRGDEADLGTYLVSGHRPASYQIELWERRMADAARGGEKAPQSWEDVEQDWSRWGTWVMDEAGGRHKWHTGPNRGEQRPPIALPGLSDHQADPAEAADVGVRAHKDRDSSLTQLASLAPANVHRPLKSEPWHFARKRTGD